MINYIKKYKKELLFVAIITLLFYLLSNGYGFFNINLSYDSLKEFIADEWTINHRFEVARIIDVLYIKLIRGTVASPLLVFVGGYIWLTLAVYTFIKLFNIEDNYLCVALVSGIMTTNYVVSDLAITNPQQLDVNMLALFASVLSVYFWNKQTVKDYVFASICNLISYGIYSSYLQVTILLVAVKLINDLLEKKSFKETLIKGLYAIAAIILGVVAYTVVLKISLSILSIELTNNRSGIDSLLSLETKDIIELIVDTYLHGAWFLIDAYSVESNLIYIVINIAYIVIFGIIVILKIYKNKIKGFELLLLLLLCGLLPLFTNMVYLATNGTVKTMLAKYAQILLPVLPLLFIHKYYDLSKTKAIVVIMILITLLNNIQFSNACYSKKDLEDKATLSYLTRVIDRIELDDKYEAGISKVIFVGDTKKMLDKIPGFENLYRVNGQEYPISTTGRKKFIAYFDYILINPIIIADEEPWDAMQTNTEALRLSIFPAEKCSAIIDGYYVIRLS